MASAQTRQLAIADGTDRVLQLWGVDQGLPNNALTDVIQTRDGYLWVASWAGVARFDGARFTPLPVLLPTTRIRRLHQGLDDAVWMGTMGGGVSRFHDGKLTTFTAADGLAGDHISAIDHDRQGATWMAADGGVSKIEGDRITSWRVRDGRFPEPAIGLGSLGGDAPVVATAKGACRLDVNTWRCVSTWPAPATAFLLDRDGRHWIGTSAGLFEAGADGRPAGACAAGCFTTHSVRSLMQSADGAIWIGSTLGSLFRLHGGEARAYGAETGIPSFIIGGLFEDAERSVWMAMSTGGLVQLRPARVTVFSVADGLTSEAPGSIVEDGQGNIWAGSSCGAPGRLAPGGRRFAVQFARELGDACTLSVLAASNGDIWFGTEEHGAYRWDGRSLIKLGPKDGLVENAIYTIFEDRDGVIWLATPAAVYRYADGRLTKQFGRDVHPAGGSIVSIVQDKAGRLWFGSNGQGLTLLEGGTFRTLSESPDMPKNISALLVDSRDDLWLGTADRGLFRYRGGRLESFGVEQGLNDPLVALMVEDRDANLWVATARGIARLERAQIEAVASGARLQPIVLDRNEGLRKIEGMGGGFDPSGLRSRDGRLWFSTIDGIVVVDPATFRINQQSPRPLIETVRVDGQAPVHDLAGRVVVPAGADAIEWTYTGFSLLVPARTRFRYRLAGADRQWQEAGGRRIATYGQLPPGEYTFEVMAANNDGVWGADHAAMQVVVLPFFWERRSVQAAAILMLLLATGFGANSLARRRAQRKLEQMEREQALTRERTRIARDLHDDLGSRLSQIALIAEASGTPELLDRISSTAREALQTMDELVWAVDAQNDTLESLAGYVAEFAESHLAQGGRRVRLQIQPDLGDREIGTDARRHLFLAFKEAAHNVIKHAHATEVRVALVVDVAGVSLEVADNGVGMTAAPGGGMGNGLRNMRERMQAAGGTIEMETAPGQGTRIRLRVPIAGAAR